MLTPLFLSIHQLQHETPQIQAPFYSTSGSSIVNANSHYLTNLTIKWAKTILKGKKNL